MPKEPTPAPQEQTPTVLPKRGNGTSVFHVLDPEGFEIVLEIERWDHIVVGHPEIKPLLDLLELTISGPEVIMQDGCRKETHYYYRLTGRSVLRRNDLYLVAVVRRSTTEKQGTVRTAYLVKGVRKGQLVWLSRK
jgi:hypothetical protein